jgi:hypothetical protein
LAVPSEIRLPVLAHPRPVEKQWGILPRDAVSTKKKMPIIPEQNQLLKPEIP